MFTTHIRTSTRICTHIGGKMPFYAVRRGRNVGIYNDWDSCKAQVHGYGGARYKKFNSPEEAQAFVNGQDSGGFSNYTSGGQSSYKYSWDSAQSYSSCYSNETPQHSSHYSYQHQKKYTSGHRSSPYTCSSRQYSSSSTSSGSTYKGSEEDHVYTDGCCRNNGRDNPVAGVGVYWGPDHPSNVSERLPGRATNNRAEIHAARIAVKQAKEKGMGSVTVVTDSQFLINGITSWIHKWKKNGWTLSDNTKVKNEEDWKSLDSEMQGIDVKFKHVPGHRGVDGNEAADRLANEGAMKIMQKKSWFN
ncbi:ribonuclease H1 [Magallana gigas]|uniref:ribonuclease H1 n=1 Tax=Magallana gigas TaxID=29159 RepID=UPI003340971E